MSSSTSRFEAVSRRHFLALGGLGALALTGVACSNDDSKAFSSATTSAPGTTAAPGTAAPGTTAPGTTGPGTTAPGTTTAGATTTAAMPSGPAWPATAKVDIAFTFAATAGDRVRNPYVVVWIERPDGTLVQNLAIWYNGREPRYVSHLTRWYGAESTLLNGGGTDNTAAVSGATRPAGQYQLSWDGTDVAGKKVAQGDYVVCIEAAREHGPYELITGNVTVGTKAATSTFTPSGELTAASAAYTV